MRDRRMHFAFKSGGLDAATAVFALFWLATLVGCGDGNIGTYPVAGTVMVDNKPADGAMVIFVPTSTAPEAQRKRPFGMTDAQGKFNVMTFEPGDGAPAGQYKVLVQWPAANTQSGDHQAGRRGSLGPDRLKGKYFNLESTKLTASVEEQSNELQPFQLQSR